MLLTNGAVSCKDQVFFVESVNVGLNRISSLIFVPFVRWFHDRLGHALLHWLIRRGNGIAFGYAIACCRQFAITQQPHSLEVARNREPPVDSNGTGTGDSGTKGVQQNAFVIF
jgi:hypothetical protein